MTWHGWQVTQVRKMSARARWAVPAGAVATIGIVIGATAGASAAEPSLPARSGAPLLVDVQHRTSRPPGPPTPTLQETPNLRPPPLPHTADLTRQPRPPPP